MPNNYLYYKFHGKRKPGYSITLPDWLTVCNTLIVNQIMSFESGIKKCEDTLKILSSKSKPEIKVEKAFSKIAGLEPTETSLEQYEKVVRWCEEYLVVTDRNIKLDGILKEIDKLSHDLEDLCMNIIEHNKGDYSTN
jgi:hypothetical protein